MNFADFFQLQAKASIRFCIILSQEKLIDLQEKGNKEILTSKVYVKNTFLMLITPLLEKPAKQSVDSLRVHTTPLLKLSMKMINRIGL